MSAPLTHRNRLRPPKPIAWPYPRWLAHRGAGKLAPENTLAAFRHGAALGWQMFECDVQLSADDVPFLLHDDTLERTSTGTGVAGQQIWAQLSQLDAGAWHSAGFAGEALPSLVDISTFCLAHALALNIEIKPSPGTEARTGEVVALAALKLWSTVSQAGALPPLLSSFSITALKAAKAAAPELPRALLVDDFVGKACEHWLDVAQGLQCLAVVFNHHLWTAQTAHAAHTTGLHALAYTVNDAHEAQRLWDLGLSALITDQVDSFKPQAFFRPTLPL